jgi:signal transduction histidine kinase
MRSMFVKLFFCFLLTTLLSGFVFFQLASSLRQGEHKQRVQRFVSERNEIVRQALTIYGTAAAAWYEREGSAPKTPVADSEAAAGMAAHLFAGDGTPLSEGVPQTLQSAVRGTVAGRGNESSKDGGRYAVVIKVVSPSGKAYLAATEVKPRKKPSKFRGPFPPDFWLHLLITVVISGVVCYLLSWRITAPVRRLRSATQGLAVGNLASRVTVSGTGAGDELTDLGRDFNLMAARIEKLVTVHKQLVRDVSHELRSPLARLNVALGIARKQSAYCATGALDRIELEGQRLNLLIGELLTLSQLEGGVAGERTEVDLAELADEVAQDADFEARGCNRRVQLAASPALLLQGNREMLRRALENVVRNAVRYTAEGSAVEVILEGAAGSQAVLLVRDFGPGVPEAQLADIFRPFYRVAESRDRQSGGTGIGLAISERIVSLHGGSVAARNLLNAGLEVEIRLPMDLSR